MGPSFPVQRVFGLLCARGQSLRERPGGCNCLIITIATGTPARPAATSAFQPKSFIVGMGGLNSMI